MATFFRGQKILFDYTGTVQSIQLSPGRYKLEAWGAQGGTMAVSPWTGVGGKGGYSCGIIKISTLTTLYIYVGQQGQGYNGSACHYGGWNGGGHCYAGASGGGGATDISLLNDACDSSNHLFSRILVAGGGGGSNDNVDGGHGGGLIGDNGMTGNATIIGQGGTQTAGGAGWLNGTFGIGGGSTSSAYSDGGAGGGGWYGGGKSQGDNSAGGGGSGYVYTEETANHYPVGCLLNTSYYLTDTFMEAGVNEGHGHVQITCIDGPALFIGDSLVFNCTKTRQAIELDPGRYKLECYGASGGIGDGNINPFGKGGYVSGELFIVQPLILYVHVGEDGIDNWTTSMRYNGGGAASNVSGHNGGAGGGATDFRLSDDAWDDEESLKTRILVAGGGGGAQPACGTTGTAGNGGNLIGMTSYNQGYQNRTPEVAATRAYSQGGTQDAGGTAYNVNDSKTTWVTPGRFGAGANSVQCGAGGGGGWYGGASGYTSGGGGGSSYAAGYEECNHDYTEEQKYIALQNVVFEQGVNTGNGIAVITVLSLIANARKNSNFYKDTILNSVFDMETILKLCEEE